VGASRQGAAGHEQQACMPGHVGKFLLSQIHVTCWRSHPFSGGMPVHADDEQALLELCNVQQ
jgi:hypothetical protein